MAIQTPPGWTQIGEIDPIAELRDAVVSFGRACEQVFPPTRDKALKALLDRYGLAAYTDAVGIWHVEPVARTLRRARLRRMAYCSFRRERHQLY